MQDTVCVIIVLYSVLHVVVGMLHYVTAWLYLLTSRSSFNLFNMITRGDRCS
jgi:hypothetical protein